MPTIMRNGVPTYVSVEEYNRELADHRKNVLGIDESTGKLRHNEVADLDKIWVNGQEFTGMAYQGLLTVNTKTYVEEPVRSNDGSIPNINDYDTFVVPRCKVNFKYFNIEDYRRLCDAIQSNEFYVKYYDKQLNEFVQHKMYCEPEEMHKLYNIGADVIGVIDYEISFIGTLNDTDKYELLYQPNGGEVIADTIGGFYNPDEEYSRGDTVYLINGGRWFLAIYYEDTFKEQPVTNTSYWERKDFSLYNSTSIYNAGDIVYEQLTNGRNYYIAVRNTPNNHSLTDSYYFQKIVVKAYSPSSVYSKGQYVIQDNLLYEAIYYHDTFSGHYPTETKYWKQIPVGHTGISVRWGESIVVADPNEFFNFSGYSANSWNTKEDGTGSTYFAGQSLNVFKNITLYPEWKKGE